MYDKIKLKSALWITCNNQVHPFAYPADFISLSALKINLFRPNIIPFQGIAQASSRQYSDRHEVLSHPLRDEFGLIV